MKNPISILSLVLISSLWQSCNQNGLDQESPSKQKQEDDKKLITEVRVIVAEKKRFQYLIHTQGTIRAKQQSALHFSITGIIDLLNKGNGDRVRKGEIIAELNKKSLQLALEKAKVNLKEKALVFEDMAVQYFGEDEIPENGKIHELLKTKSGLSRAEISFEEAEWNLENTVIKAPFSGVLANLKIKISDPINSSDKIGVIYNPNHLLIESDILEDDVSQIKLNQKVSFRVLSNLDSIYQAIVIEINPMINENGLVRIKSELERSMDFLPGMAASVTIEVPKSKNIIIPTEAVVIRSGKQVVFTLENGLAKWNYVIVGLQNGREIEILEGLNDQDQVILTNNLNLSHDSQVTLVVDEL